MTVRAFILLNEKEIRRYRWGYCEICGGYMSTKHGIIFRHQSCVSRQPRSEETRNKMALAKMGWKNPMLGKRTRGTTGKPSPFKGKSRGPNLKLRGEAHYLWKGGITPEMVKIRGSIPYKMWRSTVFARDNYTCTNCGKKGGYLEAHHNNKSFAQIIQENKITTCEQALQCAPLWDTSNGRTMCFKCHRGKD